MVTGAPVRTRHSIAGLIMLAVLVMMFCPVTAMPVATASWQDQAVNQVSASMRTELGEQEPSLPCHHHGSERGPLCCSAGACLMLMFSLPARERHEDEAESKGRSQNKAGDNNEKER